MAKRIVRQAPDILTHGGAEAALVSVEDQLRRSVLSCLLWEDEFYENGVAIAERIKTLAQLVDPTTLAALAVEARHVMKLRAVPLWLLVHLVKIGKGERRLIVDTIDKVVQRADEPGKLLDLYWKSNGANAPLSNPLRLGLAKSLAKFDTYQMEKYAKVGTVRLRDVVFLTHPKPTDEALYKRLAEDTTKAPETWEADLSAGLDKRETFERLLKERKLGYMALLRNLRNMVSAGCDAALVKEAIRARRGADRVLPFRFVAAATHAPAFAADLSLAMAETAANLPKLPGKTLVVVDVSGSMAGGLSTKSTMTRAIAAATLGALLREMCEESVLYATAGSDYKRTHATREIRDGLRGIELANFIWSLCRPLGGGGIFVKQVCDFLHAKHGDVDRVVLVTDEQDTSGDDSPRRARPPVRQGGHAYMVNVASARNGVNFGQWTHIDGWSDGVLRYIALNEGVGIPAPETEEQAEAVAA